MSLLLTCGQLIQALKNNDSVHAYEFERALASITLGAALQLVKEVPALTLITPVDDAVKRLDIWDGEMRISVRPADGDYSKSMPKCTEGLDDEGWTD